MSADPPRVRPWSVVLFRTLVTAEAVFASLQAVLAGGFLSGHYAALSLHAANATLTGVTAIAMTVAAVLLWRPGGGPGWPALACGLLFGAEGGQIAMGYARVLAVHVPLGVAIIVAAVAMLRWAWRPLTPRLRSGSGAAVPGPREAPEAPIQLTSVPGKFTP